MADSSSFSLSHARTTRWRSILTLHAQASDLSTSDPHDLLEQLDASASSTRAWLESSGAERMRRLRPPGVYALELVPSSSKYERKISADLNRTFSAVGVSQTAPQDIKVLRNVLRALSVYDTTTGYVQGLNFVVALLIAHRELGEEDIFWIICSMLGPRYRLGALLREDKPWLSDYIGIFCTLVAKRMPKLHAHFADNCFPLSVHAVDWFTTLFVSPLDAVTASCVLDLFLLHVPDVLLRMGLALLRLLETRLLKASAQELMLNFKDYVSSVDGCALIAAALREQPLCPGVDALIELSRNFEDAATLSAIAAPSSSAWSHSSTHSSPSSDSGGSPPVYSAESTPSDLPATLRIPAQSSTDNSAAVPRETAAEAPMPTASTSIAPPSSELWLEPMSGTAARLLSGSSVAAERSSRPRPTRPDPGSPSLPGLPARPWLRIRIPFADRTGEFTRYTLECVRDGGHSTGWIVEKRFKSVLSLHKALTRRYPYVVLPSPPSKRWMRNKSSRTVEQRRVELEAYFHGLARINVLEESPVLLAFLQESDVAHQGPSAPAGFSSSSSSSSSATHSGYVLQQSGHGRPRDPVTFATASSTWGRDAHQRQRSRALQSALQSETVVRFKAMASRHGWSDEEIADLLEWARAPYFNPTDLAKLPIPIPMRLPSRDERSRSPRPGP